VPPQAREGFACADDARRKSCPDDVRLANRRPRQCWMRGQLRSPEAKGIRFATGADWARWAGPAMRGRPRRLGRWPCSPMKSRIFPREQPSGHSGDVPRGVPDGHAAPDDQFSAAHRPGPTFNPELVDPVHDERLSKRACAVLTCADTVVDVAREPPGPRRETYWRIDPTWFHDWGSRRCAASRVTRPSRTKRHVLANAQALCRTWQPESGMNCAPPMSRCECCRDIL